MVALGLYGATRGFRTTTCDAVGALHLPANPWVRFRFLQEELCEDSNALGPELLLRFPPERRLPRANQAGRVAGASLSDRRDVVVGATSMLSVGREVTMIENLRAGARVATLGFLCFSACSSTAPANTKAWQSMDRRALDRAYNNSAAVPESAQMFKDWQARSAQVREQHPEHLDLAYGPRERNRIDYFSAGPNTPVLIFFHGGFWQMRSKADFSFLAESFLGQGISVAMVGYPLAPEVTLDDIVADAHTAVRYLAAQLPSLGGDPARVVVSGWSSGGHLATSVLDEPSLRGGVAISGLYDLAPLVKSYVNDKLHMDEAMARRNSPMLNLPPSSKPLELFAGSAELPEMRRQTADYATARRGAALPVHYEEISGANHYTILNDMLRPEGRIHQAVAMMVGIKPSMSTPPGH